MSFDDEGTVGWGANGADNAFEALGHVVEAAVGLDLGAEGV